MADAPLVDIIFAAGFEAAGLLGLGGDESERLVNGVRPLAREDALLDATACELWLKTEEAVLVSELAEPMPRKRSPGSEWRGSSEFGE